MSSYRLPDGSVPVLLSSDSAELLRQEAAAILDYTLERPEVTPNAIADMLFRTRIARRYRALVMVTERDELVDALRAVANGEPHAAVVAGDGPATQRRVAYVFPGQGSQYPGMGMLYYERSPAFRAAVDECEALFQDLYGLSPLAYLLGDGEFDEDVRRVQPALFMQMIGLAAMWRAAGVEPAAVVGHSQGEIAAATVAGMQSLADGVRVVTLRANIIGERGLTGYSMAVVGVDRDECESLLARNSGWAELSVINSAHVIAISGDRPVVLEVVAALTEQGKFAKEIRVAYPAHTSVVAQFRKEMTVGLLDDLENPQFLEPTVPCLGSTLGGLITPDFPVGDYWYWNLRNKVRFDRAVEEAAALSADTFVEIANHPALLLAIQENLSTVVHKRNYQVIGTSRRQAESLREFTRNLAGVAVSDLDYRWDALSSDESDARPALPLLDFPNTQMATKKMWAPYRRSAATAAVTEPVAPPTSPAQQLVENWVRLERRKLVPPKKLTVLDASGASSELSAAVHAAAGRHGARIVYDGSADTAVILVPPATGTDVHAVVDDVARYLGDTSWLPALDAMSTEVWLVTVGGEPVTASDTPNPFHASVTAGFRCLATEHPGVAFRHLDLAAGDDAAASAKALLGAIHTKGEPELAVRDGGVFAKRVVEESDVAPAFDVAGRHVVIVGGTGKLGLEFCAQFAKDGARRVTLLSRSAGSKAAVDTVRSIDASGETQVVVRTCDIGDDSSVDALGVELADVPADLIVHAAVDYDAAIATADDASVRAAAAAKVIGLDTVLRHLPRAQDARVVLCSSLSATMGGRGHMVYAAVNRLLDAMAFDYRARGIDCVSVQWGLWRETGSGNAEAESRISGAGLLPMDPADAIARGITTHAGNSIVVAAQWDRIRDIFAVFGFDTTYGELESEVVVEPATEIAESEPEVAVADSSAPAVDTAERVRLALRTVMGMDSSEVIEGDVPLVALGLDSLQALDLRKRIESELSRDLPVTAILGGASLDEVVSLIG